MTQNQVLDEIASRITQATQAVETQLVTLRAARALRTQLETERRQAAGRLGAGDAAAGPDLDRLGEELVTARHAVQDTEQATTTAQAALPRLARERQALETSEIIRHLTALLPVRAALAAEVQTHLATLAAAVQLYQVAVQDSGRLAALLPAPVMIVPPSMDGHLARASIQVLRRVLSSEFRYGNQVPEPPLPTSDTEVTRGLRESLARLAAPARP